MGSKSFRPTVAILALALLTSTAALAWEIPLTLDNPSPAKAAPFVSGGVPLLVGQAKETAELRLAAKGADGKLAAVPAQFRVLARWWRDDNSIRWVLVDTAADFKPGEKKTLVLTNEKLPEAAPAVALKVEETPETITVITGPAKFVINRKKFSFIERAVVSADGKFADGDDLLAGSADGGIVVKDTYGEKYFSSEGTAGVEVIEKGALRVCVRARGRNLARDGKGYSRGMYGYDVFMHFYAGSADVYSDVVLANNAKQAIGIPTFKDASLVLKLKGGAAGYTLIGDKAEDGKLAAGESACLYQDSNGTDSWQSCPGLGYMSTSGWSGLETPLTSFKGYKILKRADGKEQEAGAGSQAGGTLKASNAQGGVVVHTRNFWQQFPKAAEVGADGTVRVGLFPGEFKAVHYLEDASAKGHEIILHFFNAKARDAYDCAADGTPLAAAVAGAWDARVFPRPDVKHCGETGALSDTGPYTVPTIGIGEKPPDKIAITGGRWLGGDGYYGNAAGWQVFGDRWRSNGGHSRNGARQPIKEECYLYRWYISGIPDWLALGDARSRHYRDVRQYRIDDQDALAFKAWGDFRAANVSENGEWAKRPLPNDEELKKHQQGFYRRADWGFPNPEHCTLDLLYDRYLIFGDQRALENMRVATGHGAFFAIGNAPGISRAQGWSWRTLERYWDLTGDKRAEELLKDTMKANAVLIDKKPLWSGDPAKPNIWFTQIFARAVAVTALHTGDPKMLELTRAFADGKEERADYFCAPFAVVYHLTGEEKYKEAVMKKTKDGERLLGVVDVDNFENMGKTSPTSVHWLLNAPPKGK
jgi:hypothetical protein